MEKQKEKKRKVSSFPIDLTSEILLKLPEKSIARFRCVSKLWLSITTDPYFIKLFETRNSRPCLLVCFVQHGKLFVSSILQNSKRSSYSCSSQPIDLYHFKSPINHILPPTESVQGLFCFQESATPIVCNPSTREILTLPKPRMSWKNVTVFLGYDPVGGEHKVMCMPYETSSDTCRVLTLGSAKKLWRTVKTEPSHCSTCHTSGRCIKGVVYYTAYVYRTRVWVIMSFDVRFEKFGMIHLPYDRVHMYPLIAYKGTLAFVITEITNTKDGKKITLCVLEDVEKHKWSSKCFIGFMWRIGETLHFPKVIGCTEVGEFICVIATSLNTNLLF
ncbi:putative F-box protein At1g47765 [Capsella rubella]|uniref:putative F-box protein At1g47765 n=1 Tax=Capsella rubella TaxID=81985 RepID=UPI000CD59D04|nr:putative F-box protein At1g47765 [Capsella rubella]